MNVRVAAAIVLLCGVTGAVLWLSRPVPQTSGSQTSGQTSGQTLGQTSGSPSGASGTGSGASAAGALSGGNPAAPAAAGNGPPGGFAVAADCRACHSEVYAEWEKSYHGMAWTDPMVQALSNGFRMSECIDCHAPLPIHVTGVAERVAPRKHARSDGVDCLSCHLMEDGVSVAATRTVDTSGTPGACRPVEVRTMKENATCAGCHNQHETVLELEASGIGKTCSDCHMEPVARAGGKTGRGHVFPGAHSVEMHRRAAQLDVRVEGGAVVARVSNVGAGHRIPTDARHRSYNLWITVRDPKGNPIVVQEPIPQGEFRLYYRTDFRESTQIDHGKFREAKWVIPEGIRGTAEVRLTYALNPEELARFQVYDVHRATVTLP